MPNVLFSVGERRSHTVDMTLRIPCSKSSMSSKYFLSIFRVYKHEVCDPALLLPRHASTLPETRTFDLMVDLSILGRKPQSPCLHSGSIVCKKYRYLDTSNLNISTSSHICFKLLRYRSSCLAANRRALRSTLRNDVKISAADQYEAMSTMT